MRVRIRFWVEVEVEVKVRMRARVRVYEGPLQITCYLKMFDVSTYKHC